MMEEHNIQSLSQLLRLNHRERSERSSHAVPKYLWTKYFKKDCTFSPFCFQKQKTNTSSASAAVVTEEISTAKVTEKISTARDLRNYLLCSMIKLHNLLYKGSSNYKGMSKNAVFMCLLKYLCFFSFCRVGIFRLCILSLTSIYGQWQ